MKILEVAKLRDKWQSHKTFSFRVTASLLLFAIWFVLTDPACLAAPPFRQKSSDQINLLGTEPSKDPGKAKAVYNKGVDYWNAGSRAYNGGNSDRADAYYQQAVRWWKKACDLGWADGCRGSYGIRKGALMPYWGE